MTSNRFTVSSTNFTLTANGTITAKKANLTDATITGDFQTVTTNGYYTRMHGNAIEFYSNSKRLAFIAPLDITIGSDVTKYKQLCMCGSGNYHGIGIGAVFSSGNEIYYDCAIQDYAAKIGCRHRFKGDIKFLDGFVKSNINFADNYGVAWGGNVGLLYRSNGNYGLYLGITANNCPLYFAATVHNSIKFTDGNGINLHDSPAFRYWSDMNAVVVGASGTDLRLVGSSVLANGSTVATTSDARKKKDITPLTAKHLNLIKAIEPVSFSYTSDLANSGRTHTGFIAQQVLSTMENLGIDTQEFAAFIDVNRRGEEYALRYEEFIPLLLMYIKHLDQRLTSIENGGTN